MARLAWRRQTYQMSEIQLTMREQWRGVEEKLKNETCYESILYERDKRRKRERGQGKIVKNGKKGEKGMERERKRATGKERETRSGSIEGDRGDSVREDKGVEKHRNG